MLHVPCASRSSSAVECVNTKVRLPVTRLCTPPLARTTVRRELHAETRGDATTRPEAAAETHDMAGRVKRALSGAPVLLACATGTRVRGRRGDAPRYDPTKDIISRWRANEGLSALRPRIANSSTRRPDTR